MGNSEIVNLKTQGREAPFGMDAAHPAFSWQMRSSAVGAAQTAYQITVWDEENHVVWDSGEVESAASNEVLYEGETLEPSAVYSWQVKVTDQTGSVLESGIASFVTGLMSESFDAWDGAQWIGAPSLPLDAASSRRFISPRM